LQLAEQYRLRAVLPMLRLNLGLVQFELGELQSARRNLLAVEDELRETGQLQTQLAVDLGLARVEIGLREYDPALARLRRVVSLARAKLFASHPAVAAAIFGELLAQRGERVAAARVFLAAADFHQFDAMDREGVQLLIQRLALSPAELTAARDRLPTLDQVLAQLDSADPAPPAPPGAD
jgi:predicted negative regulator of RcsB-dependent stress response